MDEQDTELNVITDILEVLDESLNLKGRSAAFDEETPLLGSLPELDSMAVLSVIAHLEERYGFSLDDDEIDGSVFATVGSLVSFVRARLKAA